MAGWRVLGPRGRRRVRGARGCGEAVVLVCTSRQERHSRQLDDARTRRKWRRRFLSLVLTAARAVRTPGQLGPQRPTLLPPTDARATCARRSPRYDTALPSSPCERSVVAMTNPSSALFVVGTSVAFATPPHRVRSTRGWRATRRATASHRRSTPGTLLLSTPGAGDNFFRRFSGRVRGTP